MRVSVITPPAPVLAWAEAQRHLRLDGDDTQQTLVEGLIAAATAHLDGPDGWLGRALGPQTLEVAGSLFDASPIALPFPPVVALNSITYVDPNGEQQALVGGVLRGYLLNPPYGVSWPTVGADPEPVRVRYQAGYEALPAPIRAAILLMVDDLWNNRGTVETGLRAAAVTIPMSTTVENLLAPFRVWG